MNMENNPHSTGDRKTKAKRALKDAEENKFIDGQVSS